MATEAGGDLRCGIGARMRGARERAGMSILQAAEKLHADPRVLEALEAERFDELGAAVFVRGHIRRYAELVRENSQELQDMYAASSHAVARPDLTRIPTTHGSRSTDPRRLLVPGLAFVIVVGAVGLALWFFKDLKIPDGLLAKSDGPATVTAEPAPLADETPVNTPPAEASSVDALSPDVPQPDSRTADVTPPSTPAQSSASSTGAPPSAPTSGASGTTTGSVSRTAAVTPPPPASGAPSTTPAPARVANATPSVASKPAAPATVQPRSEVPTSSRSAAVQTPPPAAATQVAPPVAAVSPPAPAASAPVGTSNGKIMEFTLRFSGDSWAEVYDAKGAKLFYDVGSADSVKTMSGSPPLRVILGNPSGVAVEVNGKSATVPKMKGDNGVQFTVFRNGRLSRGRAAPSGQ